VTVLFFMTWGRKPHAQPPQWLRVSLLVLDVTFDLSVMRGPTGSYATTGLALRII
jgi:hypothetical protein